MPKRRLEQLLKELHAELENSRQVDENARMLLRGLMKDIRAALDEEEGAAADDAGLERRLRESIDHFEAGHPTLALNIRRVLDTLGRIS